MATPAAHPIPHAGLPSGVDPESERSVQQFVRAHQFPSANGGRYLFAFMDEDDRFETVRLRHGLAGYREPPAFVRCAAPGSGVLHLLELHAPAVHRVEYRLECIDREGQSFVENDPLNPHIVRDPFASKSVLAAPEYQAPDYANESSHSTSASALIETSIPGPLSKPWPTWIWSPAGERSNRRLPIVLFLDGGDWLTLNHADRILTNLVGAKRIAPCRAVFMKPASRNEEYAANPLTAAFLSEELPHMLKEHIPWPRAARDRIAVGCSLGGLCLLHAHYSVPDLFGRLILQSGSFFQQATDSMESGFAFFKRIEKFVSAVQRASDRSLTRIPIVMTCGAGEENLLNNRIMAESLTRQGFPLTFHLQPDAHNWTCWRDCIGNGLTRLLPVR